MSVALAPRALIAEKAAWPGVSMNVMTPLLSVATAEAAAVEVGSDVVPVELVAAAVMASLMESENAEMCWVMPPNSLSTMREDRRASKRVVLPWST